jgi:hypothetical protein
MLICIFIWKKNLSWNGAGSRTPQPARLLLLFTSGQPRLARREVVQKLCLLLFGRAQHSPLQVVQKRPERLLGIVKADGGVPGGPFGVGLLVQLNLISLDLRLILPNFHTAEHFTADLLLLVLRLR